MGLDTQIKQYDFDSWWLYVEACRKMAHLNNFTMRELDRALWQYSKEHQPPEKSTVKMRVKRTTKTQTPTRLVP
jgi:hypothetical protein